MNMSARPAAKLRVYLHDRAHQRFVPRVPPGGVLLGVVERGMHIGALAKLQDGTFVQVNGDVIQPLNRSQVEAALRRAAPACTRRAPPTEIASPTNAGAVVVTIKRRRTALASISSAAVPDDRG